MTKTLKDRNAHLLRLASVGDGEYICEAHNNLHASALDFHYDDAEHTCLHEGDDFTDCANIE